MHTRARLLLPAFLAVTASAADLAKSSDPGKEAKLAPTSKPAAKAKESSDSETKAEGGPAIKRAGGGPENPVLKFHPLVPKALTPQEELKTLKLPKGFHAELVATEPMIDSPIAVSWDDQARMYVLEMRGY